MHVCWWWLISISYCRIIYAMSYIGCSSVCHIGGIVFNFQCISRGKISSSIYSKRRVSFLVKLLSLPFNCIFLIAVCSFKDIFRTWIDVDLDVFNLITRHFLSIWLNSRSAFIVRTSTTWRALKFLPNWAYVIWVILVFI